MDETELLEKLDSLRKSGEVDQAIVLLKENTGKGKMIDPSNTQKMEQFWSGFANPLYFEGKLADYRKVCNEMLSHLMNLQQKDGVRYHKGWPTYSIGLSLMGEAVQNVLLSFVEDTISACGYPQDALSTAVLQGIFKVDSEYLSDLSKSIIAKATMTNDPSKVLAELGVKGLPAELWTLEYSMRKVEKKFREFIEKQLSRASPNWWKDMVPEELKKQVEEKIGTSSRVLWFSEQSTSPLDYFSFPSDYIKLLSCEKCWPLFEPAFQSKAILTGRLEGLAHIRHKIAHYRKVTHDEKIMFEKAIAWLEACMK